MRPRALAHRVAVVYPEAFACGIAVGAGGVVHRALHHADEGEGHVVERHVGIAPLEFLQPEDAFEIDDIGIGAVLTRGFVNAVDIEHQAVRGGDPGKAVDQLDGLLVVAVDKVDLEAADT